MGTQNAAAAASSLSLLFLLSSLHGSSSSSDFAPSTNNRKPTIEQQKKFPKYKVAQHNTLLKVKLFVIKSDLFHLYFYFFTFVNAPSSVFIPRPLRFAVMEEEKSCGRRRGNEFGLVSGGGGAEMLNGTSLWGSGEGSRGGDSIFGDTCQDSPPKNGKEKLTKRGERKSLK